MLNVNAECEVSRLAFSREAFGTGHFASSFLMDLIATSWPAEPPALVGGPFWALLF